MDNIYLPQKLNPNLILHSSSSPRTDLVTWRLLQLPASGSRGASALSALTERTARGRAPPVALPAGPGSAMPPSPSYCRAPTSAPLGRGAAASNSRLSKGAASPSSARGSPRAAHSSLSSGRLILLPNLGADAAPPQPSGRRCSSPTSASVLLLPDVGPAHLVPNLGAGALFSELLPDLEQVYKFMDWQKNSESLKLVADW